MNYRKEIESLVDILRKHGITMTGVDTGPEWEAPTLDNLMACNDVCVGLKYRDTTATTVMRLVYGNEPGYMVSDWLIPTKSPEFAAALETAVEEYGAKWDVL